MACNSLPRAGDMGMLGRERGALSVIAGMCAALAITPPAQATTFVRMDERDLAARSVAAATGTVTDVRAARGRKGAVETVVVIEPDEVLFGVVPEGPITLREPGGRLNGRNERVFGSPDYAVGEQVLAFLSARPDGTFRTTAMAMGKYAVRRGAGGEAVATRRFGAEVTVVDPDSGRLENGNRVEVERLADLTHRLRGRRSGDATVTTPSLVRRSPSGDRRMAPRPPSRFTFLGQPSRWFEPDEQLPIAFRIDASGDARLGPEASAAAAVDALAAWSAVPAASLLLTDGLLADAQPFAGCGSPNRIVFNDPFDEIDASTNCRGVLAIGGYCYTEDTRTVNGTAFRHIRVGKITVADGYADCPFWNACNLAEIVTHEVGHTIGLGHSQDPEATMAGTANFDGRCAALGADDVAAVTLMYPLGAAPTATPTATSIPPTPTRTPIPTRTPTEPARPTASRAGGIAGRVTYYRGDVPVPDVTISLVGAARVAETATTAATGQYTLADVPAGAWAIEPSKAGETGTALTALDAAYVLQASAGLRALDAVQQIACDVTGNGSVSPLDAVRILQRKVSAADPLPAAELCGSEWIFYPDAAPAANQEIVLPALGPGLCRRGALTFTPFEADAHEQSFRAALFGDCSGSWVPTTGGRAAEPALAPAGTSFEMGALRRVRGGRWRLPLGVRSPEPIHALDLDLRYDVTRLQVGHVGITRLGDAALLHSGTPAPGRLTIAVASAEPIPVDGRAVVVVDFTAATEDVAPRLVRAFSILADERLVPTPAR